MDGREIALSDAATQIVYPHPALILDAAERQLAEEAILRGYQQMAADEEEERLAFEWIEAGLGETP